MHVLMVRESFAPVLGQLLDLENLQGLQNPDGSLKTECGIHVAEDIKGIPKRLSSPRQDIDSI